MPEIDDRRHFGRSRRNLLNDFLPLADEWGLWDNQRPLPRQIADSENRKLDHPHAMFDSHNLQYAPPREMSDIAKIVLEAGRVVTEKSTRTVRKGL